MFLTLPHPPCQWKWLEETLRLSTAQITVIGSGIQILPTDRPVIECWSQFPHERGRLLQLVKEAGVNSHGRRTVLLSGDVHFSEALCVDNAGEHLLEFTSSGLSHAWADYRSIAPAGGYLVDDRHATSVIANVERVSTLNCHTNHLNVRVWSAFAHEDAPQQTAHAHFPAAGDVLHGRVLVADARPL